MTTLAVVLLVVVMLATDFFIIGALFSSLRATMWKPLSDAYPPVPAKSDAVRREFQSIQMGLFNLGMCVHLAVDSEHLHIEPAAMLRFFRMTGMSVPWSEARVVRRSRGNKWITLRIRKVEIKGPGWAFGLAEPS
ncbi:MAG: hypothetical protein JNK58_10300 [Phycisphaerae bacterium]|nr:hypothetical protein [Phycisphaerae bacterium]